MLTKKILNNIFNTIPSFRNKFCNFSLWIRKLVELSPQCNLLNYFKGSAYLFFSYYYRTNPKSSIWIIYLEGLCFIFISFFWFIIISKSQYKTPVQIFINILYVPSRQNCRKSNVEECIFYYMALDIECWFNKNSLLQCYFLAILPAG